MYWLFTDSKFQASEDKLRRGTTSASVQEKAKKQRGLWWMWEREDLQTANRYSLESVADQFNHRGWNCPIQKPVRAKTWSGRLPTVNFWIWSSQGSLQDRTPHWGETTGSGIKTEQDTNNSGGGKRRSREVGGIFSKAAPHNNSHSTCSYYMVPFTPPPIKGLGLHPFPLNLGRILWQT